MYAKEEDLDIFLEHCKISYFTKGSYGFVFLVESESSPYISVRNGIDKKINKMIIKLSAISNHHSYKLTSIIDSKNYSIRTASERSFEREIEIQTEVFFRTCEYLDPICPSIIHSEIKNADFDNISIKRFAPRLSKLLDKTTPDSIEYYILKLFLDQIVSGQLSMYGLICMEYADGYETIDEIYSKKPRPKELIEEYKTLARYKLIQMTLKTQYTHSDFHYGNILCKDGNVMLIDFGLSNKLDDDQWKTLKKEWDNHRYYDALESIFYPLRYDSYDLRYSMDSYGWLLGTYEIEIDEYGEFEEIDVAQPVIDKITRDLEALVEEQNKKIQELKDTFPKKFPLTEKQRQKFYQFKKEAPPRYIRNQYQIHGPEAIVPQSTRVSRLYDKRHHRRTRSLNRYTLKKRTKSRSKGSREPKILFSSRKSRNSRNTAVPRGTRR